MRKEKIILYTADKCPYCQMLKALLDDYFIDYMEFNVKEKPQALKLKEISGQDGVPVLIVGDELIIGFDEMAIKKVLNLD